MISSRRDQVAHVPPNVQLTLLSNLGVIVTFTDHRHVLVQVYIDVNHSLD